VRLDQSSSAFPAAMAASIWSRTRLATGMGTESSLAAFKRSRLSLRPKAKVAPGGAHCQAVRDALRKRETEQEDWNESHPGPQVDLSLFRHRWVAEATAKTDGWILCSSYDQVLVRSN